MQDEDELVDLAKVHEDDEMIDRVGDRDNPGKADPDDPIGSLLEAWRDEARRED